MLAVFGARKSQKHVLKHTRFSSPSENGQGLKQSELLRAATDAFCETMKKVAKLVEETDKTIVGYGDAVKEQIASFDEAKHVPIGFIDALIDQAGSSEELLSAVRKTRHHKRRKLNNTLSGIDSTSSQNQLKEPGPSASSPYSFTFTMPASASSPPPEPKPGMSPHPDTSRSNSERDSYLHSAPTSNKHQISRDRHIANYDQVSIENASRTSGMSELRPARRPTTSRRTHVPSFAIDTADSGVSTAKAVPPTSAVMSDSRHLSQHGTAPDSRGGAHGNTSVVMPAIPAFTGTSTLSQVAASASDLPESAQRSNSGSPLLQQKKDRGTLTIFRGLNVCHQEDESPVRQQGDGVVDSILLPTAGEQRDFD